MHAVWVGEGGEVLGVRVGRGGVRGEGEGGEVLGVRVREGVLGVG